MKITTLVIPREWWGRQALRNPISGKLCCLGHLGFQCGVPDRYLESQGMPRHLADNWQALFPFRTSDDVYPYSDVSHLPGDYGFYDLASAINDDIKLKQKETERQLKVLFRSRGIRLTFTGKGKL